MMNEDIKKQWVESLRKGRWRRAKEALRDSSNNSYCVLGTLEHLRTHDYRSVEDQGELEPTEVSLETMNWAGLTCASPSVCLADDDWRELGLYNMAEEHEWLGNPVELYVLNDAGVGFKRLATIIERFL